MFFPFGDTPNPPGFRAWVTWVLIALNVAIYVLISLPLSLRPPDPTDPMLQLWLQVVAPAGVDPARILASASAYDLFTFVHGFKPGAPAVTNLFSSMFLHGGFLHLAGNMLFLWIYGDNVEHRMGRLPYLLAYLGTGAVATLTYGAFAGDSLVPLVGASGAISGVLGFYFLWFPRNRVKVFVALFPFLMNVVLVPARIVLGIFVVVDNILPMLGSSGGNVAHGAHLGGFVAGLGAAALLGRLQAPKRAPATAPAGRVLPFEQGRGASPNRRLARAASELEAGRMWLAEGYPVNAYQHLVNAVKLDPDGPIGAESRMLLADLPGQRRRP